MKKKIFITRKLPSIAKDTLEKKGFLVDEPPHRPPLSQKELIQVVSSYDGILSTIYDQLTSNVLSYAKNLAIISNYGIGLDNIEQDFAKKQGIAVYNTPDVVTHSTADLTLAIFLTLIRKIIPARDYVLSGGWKAWEPDIFWGEELTGKILGIIGWGRIGQEVAKRAIGFGLKIHFYHYRTITVDPFFQQIAKQVSMEELLQHSDYLSLHVPLTKKTKGMINYEMMQKMSKKPLLINTARGGVINTSDLVKALREGLLRGAALDVTDPEPISFDHPLCKMENCLIVPHIGTATKECREKMAAIAAENILHHYRM